MADIEIHGSIKNLSNAPDIAFQYQPNGLPWAGLTAAHNGTPEEYRAPGKIRFVDTGDGRGVIEYWYKGGILLSNLVPRYENLESAAAYVEQLETIKRQVEASLDAAVDPYEDKAGYNVAANSPALTADATVGQTGVKKQRYVVTIGGAVSFLGSNFSIGKVLKAGDELFQTSGGQWLLVPRPDLALEKVLQLEASTGFAQNDGGDIILIGSSNGIKILYHKGTKRLYGEFDLTNSEVPYNSLAQDVKLAINPMYDESQLGPTDFRPILMNPETKKMIVARYGLTDKIYISPHNQFTGKNILWIGTSIPWQYQPNSYPDQIGQLLGANVNNQCVSGSTVTFWNTGIYPAGTRNLGLSGTGAEFIASGPFSAANSFTNRIENFLANTDWIFDDTGINDIAFMPPTMAGRVGDINSFDKGTLYGAYNWMAQRIRTVKPTARMVYFGMISLDHSNDGDRSVQTALVNQIKKEVAAKWGYAFIDLSTMLGFSKETMADPARIFTTDGLHPTVKATNEVLTPAIYRKLLTTF